MLIEHCEIGGGAWDGCNGSIGLAEASPPFPQREHWDPAPLPAEPPIADRRDVRLRAHPAYRVSGSPHSFCKQPRNASAAFERRRCFFQTTSMFEESGGSSGRKHTGPPGAVFTSPS